MFGIMEYFNYFLLFPEGDSQEIYHPLKFGDIIDINGNVTPFYYRQTSFSLDMNFTINFIGQNNYFRIGLNPYYSQLCIDTISAISYQNYWISTNKYFRTPYVWNNIIQRNINVFTYARLAEYTIFDRYRWFYSRGFEINANLNTIINDLTFINRTYIVSADFAYYPYFSAISAMLKLSGSYASSPQAFLGNYREYSLDTNLNSKNVANKDITSSYFLFGELTFQLWNFEVQQGLMILPIYVNRVFIDYGYRVAFLDTQYFHSVFARVTCQMPYLYEGLSSLKINFFAEAYYAINKGYKTFKPGAFSWFIGFDVGRQFDRE